MACDFVQLHVRRFIHRNSSWRVVSIGVCAQNTIQLVAKSCAFDAVVQLAPGATLGLEDAADVLSARTALSFAAPEFIVDADATSRP